MQMIIFEQLKMAGLLCSRYSATVQKGRRFFALAGKDMELPNGKGGKKKVASKRQRAASPAAPTPEGGSPAEGEMAGELLAVPGPSGMCAGPGGSVPPVPVGESAAAAIPAAMEPTVVELVVTELLPAVPAVESEDMQSGVSAAGLLGVGLPGPAAQAAAAAPAAEVVTAVRPVLVDGSAAASKEYWVLNSAVGPKVIPRDFLVEPTAAAAETAAVSVEWAGEPVPESEALPAARQAACEAENSPLVTASGPRPPTVAAAPVKRKAKAGVTGGSQKRKKSSPAEAKDL